MLRYDPNKAPKPEEWLALDEDERIRLATRYHRKHGGYGGSLRLHATLHAIVEAQLADDVEPVKAALKRLRKDGLDRHESIHAIGSVLTGFIWEILQGDGDGSAEANKEYFEKLSHLTKASWYAEYGEEG